MKKLYTLSILLLSILACADAFAQVPAAYAGSYNRMMSNISRDMSMRMMNMNFNRNYYYLNNQKYKFKVVLKDSTVLEVKSKIHLDTALHKSYLLFDDKSVKGDKKDRQRKIYSSDTRGISREEAGETRSGMATDSCWLFKVISGNINAYSPLSESYNIDSFYLRAFQVADGPIQKLDSASLAPIVKSNEKAFKAFAKKDYYKAISKYNSSK